MRRAIILFWLVLGWLYGGYYDALYCFILSKQWDIDGKFYQYDFEKNGYDYNDWLYLTKDGRAYRLLGVEPTSNNAFGWQALESVPSDITKEAGYFINLRFSGDRDSRFSWLYVSTDGRVYKLMGADSNHFFVYADVDGDGRADALPNLKGELFVLPGMGRDWRMRFSYSCSNCSGGSCCWPLESQGDCSSVSTPAYESSSSAPSSTPVPSSTTSSSATSSASSEPCCSSSSACNICNYECVASSASGVADGRYAVLDKPFHTIAGVDVKIFKIGATGSFTKIEEMRQVDSRFLLCRGECTEFDANSYYLIQIDGGCEFDIDNDGTKESNGVPNRVVLRTIVKGEWIKNASKPIALSMVSELAYEKLIGFIKYHYNALVFEQKYKEVALDLLDEDVDGDGVIDGKDVVFFQMSDDVPKLNNIYRDNLPGLFDVMRDGDYPAMKMSSILSFVWGGSPPYDIYVEGDRLYTGQTTKVKIVDISNPKSPRVEREIDVGHTIYTMIKVDNILYVGTLDGIYTIDMNTFEVRSITNGVLNVTDMALTHDKRIIFIYSIGKRWGIIDTQNGNRLYQSSILLQGASEVFVKMIDGVEYAFFANGGWGLKVVRLTPPDNLTHQVPMVWNIDTPGVAKGVWVEGRYAYVADWQEGVQIVDPFTKQIVGHIATPTLATDVNIYDGYIYVLDSEHGLMIFDRATSKLLGNIDTPLSYGYEVAVTEVGGRKIALVLEAVKTYLLDVTNPYYKDTTTAAVVQEYRNCPSVQALVRDGSLLYGVGSRNFCTFRIANNGVGLTLLQKLNVDAFLTDLVLARHTNEAYAVSYRDGLVRFNITNPAQTYLLSKGVPGSNFSRGDKIALTPDGNYVVISDANKLHFIRVYSTPAALDEIFEQVMTHSGRVNELAPIGDGGYIGVLSNYKLSFVDVSRMPRIAFTPIILENRSFQNLASFHKSKHIVFFDTLGRVHIASYNLFPTDAQIVRSADGSRRVGKFLSVTAADDKILIHTVADGIEIFNVAPLRYEGYYNTFGSSGGRFAYGKNGILFVPDGANGVAVVDTKLFEPIE